MCLSVERLHKRGPRAFGNLMPRYISADTMHENPITQDHIGYLDEWLRRQIGVGITVVNAYSVPGLIDAAAFERQREVIRTEWPKEKRRKRHERGCERQ